MKKVKSVLLIVTLTILCAVLFLPESSPASWRRIAAIAGAAAVQIPPADADAVERLETVVGMARGWSKHTWLNALCAVYESRDQLQQAAAACAYAAQLLLDEEPGNMAAVVALLERSIALTPSRIASLLRARILLKAGHPADAEGALLEMLTRFPDDADAHVTLGILYWTNGRYESAQEHMTRVGDHERYRSTVRTFYNDWHVVRELERLRTEMATLSAQKAAAQAQSRAAWVEAFTPTLADLLPFAPIRRGGKVVRAGRVAAQVASLVHQLDSLAAAVKKQREAMQLEDQRMARERQAIALGSQELELSTIRYRAFRELLTADRRTGT